MNKTQKSDTVSGTKSAAPKSSTKTFQSELQAKIDAENAQGFRGVEVDPTPNENYTVKGVTSGKPTPETDVKAASVARKANNNHLSPIEVADREKTAMDANAANTKKLKRGDK